VKLDGFHGLQRICKAVPKKDMKNRDRSDFISEVKSIIRDPNDTGSARRTMRTPQPDVIVARIESIISNPRWKNSAPEKAMKELRGLLIHAEKGCLR
jgi:hypothetical protein